MTSVVVRAALSNADVDAVATLIRSAWDSSVADREGDLAWYSLTIDPAPGVTGVLVHDESERLAAYGEYERSGSKWIAKYAVAPLSRTTTHTIERAFLQTVVDAVLACSGGQLDVWTRQSTRDDNAIAASFGLKEDRSILQMQRTLSPSDLFTDTSESVRAFRPGVDDADFVAVNNAAFNGHPEQGNWDISTFHTKTAAPWFTPSDVLVLERNGVIKASCWTKIHTDHPTIGEIYVVAVHPELQGQGVGRAIVRAGLSHLWERGCTNAVLYVDAANAPAVGLYRNLQFESHFTDRCHTGKFEKQ